MDDLQPQQRMADVSDSKQETEALAGLILTAGYDAASMDPVTDGRPGFSLADGYRVGAAVATARMARGERIAGWKIGFTNKNIWAEFGADAPIWGPMYDTSVIDMNNAEAVAGCEAARFAEPKIEPEIVLRLCAPPAPDMTDSELIACIDGVAHGFEVVQSVFPGWRFRPADTVAAFGLHGRLYHGPVAPVGAGDHGQWIERLTGFEITLRRDGVEVDRGVAANVLGGPLSALRHFADGLQHDPLGRPMQAGDLITTGTVTGAFPIESGQHWSTKISGLPLPGLELVIV